MNVNEFSSVTQESNPTSSNSWTVVVGWSEVDRRWSVWFERRLLGWNWNGCKKKSGAVWVERFEWRNPLKRYIIILGRRQGNPTRRHVHVYADIVHKEKCLVGNSIATLFSKVLSRSCTHFLDFLRFPFPPLLLYLPQCWGCKIRRRKYVRCSSNAYNTSNNLRLKCNFSICICIVLWNRILDLTNQQGLDVRL